jgi:hypothetical protein
MFPPVLKLCFYVSSWLQRAPKTTLNMSFGGSAATETDPGSVLMCLILVNPEVKHTVVWATDRHTGDYNTTNSVPVILLTDLSLF